MDYHDYFPENYTKKQWAEIEACFKEELSVDNAQQIHVTASRYKYWLARKKKMKGQISKLQERKNWASLIKKIENLEKHLDQKIEAENLIWPHKLYPSFMHESKYDRKQTTSAASYEDFRKKLSVARKSAKSKIWQIDHPGTSGGFKSKTEAVFYYLDIWRWGGGRLSYSNPDDIRSAKSKLPYGPTIRYLKSVLFPVDQSVISEHSLADYIDAKAKHASSREPEKSPFDECFEDIPF